MVNNYIVPLWIPCDAKIGLGRKISTFYSTFFVENGLKVWSIIFTHEFDSRVEPTWITQKFVPQVWTNSWTCVNDSGIWPTSLTPQKRHKNLNDGSYLRWCIPEGPTRISHEKNLRELLTTIKRATSFSIFNNLAFKYH